MNYIMAYDIINNKSRKLVSDFLIDKGFIRVQRSVFIGEAKLKAMDKIMEKIYSLTDEEEDNIMCVPISKEEYDRIILYGNVNNFKIYEEDVIYI